VKRNLSKWLLSFTVMTLCFSVVACSKSTADRPAENGTEEPEKEEAIVRMDVTDKAQLVVNIENANGINSAESSRKLIDNDKSTKFLIQSFKPNFNIDFQFDSPRLIGTYEWTSGNDAEGRDPMDWKFMGSNDGTTWTLLDRQLGEFFRSRKLTKSYSFHNKVKYKYYRLNVTAIYYGDMFQASELRLIQVPISEQQTNPITRIDSVKKDGLSLIFLNKTPEETLSYKDKMVNTFFTVYPKLLKDFNPDAQKSLYFIIDPTYDGAAYAISNVVVYSYNFMKNNPNDIDIVTHEIMHHIQAYQGGIAPGWLSEGIADYVRYAYGLNNASSGWSLPNYSSNHNYTDAYRVTARFLAWIEKHVKPGFVQATDKAIRNKTYTEGFWKSTTGKTVDELWAQYAQNPAL